MSSFFQTPSEIVTEISMSRESTPWLAVEGNSDERLLRGRTFVRPVKIVVARGWEGVREVVETCSREHLPASVVGLVDRDYRDHTGTQIEHECIALTDYRDIENMMFCSCALHRVLIEFASHNKLPKSENGEVNLKEIVTTIYQVCEKLGKLRIYCLTHGKSISFDGMEHKKFICDRTLTINESKLISHLNGRNPDNPLSLDNWQESQTLSWAEARLAAPHFVANGHDVMAVLCVALRKLWGSDGSVLPETIEGAFRIGYADEELYRSEMWSVLQKFLSPRPAA